ncbi:MAG: biotin--[acetyl-CoA-carboxylase] ligase [Synechocystis sp.]|nr:biotin--[acetyl-CoA-carboxylase] ligase [Synechocystis sp.]
MALPESDWLRLAWENADGEPFSLGRSDWFPGLRLLTPPVTDSTNRLLWSLLERGYAPPLGAIAQQQSAGRGQWGRHWRSEPGGLYLSVMLDLNLAADQAPHLVLLSAWGIAYGLQRHHIPVQLKWPNDLLLQGRKLGGIKTETKVQQGRIRTAVIGVGLNWSNPVPETGIPLQSFCQQGGIESLATLADLAEVTLAGLTLGWQRYQRQGIAAIREGYLGFFAHHQQAIDLPEGKGIIYSVTESGELIVLVGDRQQTLPPGAISLGYSSPIR